MQLKKQAKKLTKEKPPEKVRVLMNPQFPGDKGYEPPFNPVWTTKPTMRDYTHGD